MIIDVLPFLQVLLLDICLSGDNAVVIAMAASALPAKQRTTAILLGTIAAILLRITLSTGAVYLLHVPIIPILGSLALYWIAWGLFQELIEQEESTDHKAPSRSLWFAVLQIIIADVSMSVDNVLAVAAAAKDHIYAMVFGLVLSIGLMAVAAKVIIGLLDRWPWLKVVGLLLIVWVATRLLFDNYVYLLNISNRYTCK